MIKLLALDLDGTLLDDNKKISPEASEYLKNLNREKIQIVLISGRHYREITGYAKDLELNKVLGNYIVSCDGQYVFSATGQSIWTAEFLSIDDVACLWNQLKDDYYVSFFTNDNNYIIRSGMSWLKKRIKAFLKPAQTNIILLPTQLMKLKNLAVEKVVLFPKNTNRTRYPIKEMLSFTVHELSNGRIEILNNGVNKFAALQQILSLEKINIDQVAFFGDDDNDIECFKNIKNSFAMGNASQKAKYFAAKIVLTNNENGVYYGLRQLLGGAK